MHQQGIIVGIGSDGVKENNSLQLWDDMKVASILQKERRMDPTLVSAPRVLRMATIDGARALGLGEEIGSLEAGKKADLTLVNLNKLHMVPVMSGEFYNVTHNLVYAAVPSDVEHVMVDGKWVVRDGALVNADENEIIEQGTAAAVSLLERRKQFVPRRHQEPVRDFLTQGIEPSAWSGRRNCFRGISIFPLNHVSPTPFFISCLPVEITDRSYTIVKGPLWLHRRIQDRKPPGNHPSTRLYREGEGRRELRPPRYAHHRGDGDQIQHHLET